MSNFLHRQKFEFKILPQKRVICDWYIFATKCVNPGQSKSFFIWFATLVVQLDIFIEFGLNVSVPGLKSPHWNIEFRIWTKCTGVWGKFTPTKLAVFIKLYPTSEARMLHSKILPQTSKKFTQINLPYLWHFATLVTTCVLSVPGIQLDISSESSYFSYGNRVEIYTK